MQAEVADCLSNDISLAYTIAPRRTIIDELSPKYHGPAGSPVSVAKSNAHGNDEVADADDAQMKIWVEDVERQIKSAVSDPARNRTIAMWYILPEEMRYWKKRELELLYRLHLAVKKYDPFKRPTAMYEPQHATWQRLSKTIPHQDLVMVGIYPHHAGNDHNRIQIRHTMTQIVTAIRNTGSNALPVPVLEMFENNQHPYAPADVSLIPKFVRHDLYCALANGAKGVFIWSMGRRSGFRTYTAYYNAWAALSKELFDFRLHDVFFHGKVLPFPAVKMTDGPERIRFRWNQIDAEYPSISTRNLWHGDRNYILVVNSSEAPIGFSLTGLQKNKYIDLHTGREYIFDGDLSLSLPPLGVILLQSQKII
jgi:hypothetical protein